MKKPIITSLVAAPLLVLSSIAFASEPMLLSANEMDGVTAGWYSYVEKTALVGQLNVSPVTVVQTSAVNISAFGSAGNNSTSITSGNMTYISQ